MAPLGSAASASRRGGLSAGEARIVCPRGSFWLPRQGGIARRHLTEFNRTVCPSAEGQTLSVLAAQGGGAIVSHQEVRGASFLSAGA